MPIQAPVRIGVIGAGWFASRRHCPDIVEHPEAELVALCRRNPEPMQELADAFAVKHTFTEYTEMLESGLLDGVLVCSPHDLHYDHARAALDRGLHVLLEKPITLAPDAGRALAAELVPQARRHEAALIEMLKGNEGAQLKPALKSLLAALDDTADQRG